MRFLLFITISLCSVAPRVWAYGLPVCLVPEVISGVIVDSKTGVVTLPNKDRTEFLLFSDVNTIYQSRIFARMRDITVLIPDLTQDQRVQIFEHFANFYKAHDEEFVRSNMGDYLNASWTYIKREEHGNIYMIARDGDALLLFRPDGRVYFTLSKTINVSSPSSPLPKDETDPAFPGLWEVLPGPNSDSLD